MKVMILDSKSMEGHMISDYLSSLKKYKIINIKCNIENEIFIKKSGLCLPLTINLIIKLNKPDVIINCLRVLIDESQKYPSKAIYFNSFLPRYLESLCNEKVKIIHLSTDCVFSGRNGNYNEYDIPDSNTYYGKTKALGEINNNKDLTIRTSFIGPNINNKKEELFHWFMMQEGEIEGFDKAIWTGITTLELAKCIDTAIDHDITGLYHLIPLKSITKYDLLNLIKIIFKKENIYIKRNYKISINRSLIDNRKKIYVNNYRKMFEELFIWMNDHHKKYQKYLNY